MYFVPSNPQNPVQRHIHTPQIIIKKPRRNAQRATIPKKCAKTRVRRRPNQDALGEKHGAVSAVIKKYLIYKGHVSVCAGQFGSVVCLAQCVACAYIMM